MTGKQMSALLGIRLDDPSEKNITEALKLEALNNAVLRVCELIDQSQLSDLEELQAGVAVTAGVVSFAVLEAAASNTILRIGPDKGILKTAINSSGVFMTRIVLDDLQAVKENPYLAASTTHPYDYIYKEGVYVLPAAPGNVDIYYLKKPAALVANTTEFPGLDATLHEIVLDLAEGSLWMQVHQGDRATSAEKHGLDEIQAINTALGGEA